ncbi:MAG: sugar phosphate isomerase/epimerase [Lentisphaeria bacterium]|nr:sugar phosphate isomerase/epimerase [Lentisphaeria bacterium]
MKNLVFSHFFPLEYVSDNMLPSIFAEFRDNGVKNLVFTDCMIKRILKDPAYFGLLKRICFNTGIKLVEMHSPFGECYDLACSTAARRPGMIQDHITSMRYAAECGSRTYTIHIGAHDNVYLKVPNEVVRPLALAALEQLIPEAEKLGIVIAVENAFERCNNPDEVMYYVEAVDHPNVGCCFDSGHANIMEDFPGKRQEQYGPHMHNVWLGDVVQFANAFERMAPRMATCHLHDNDGFSDQHLLPGQGRSDWKVLADKLLNHAPQLLSIQSEVNVISAGCSIRKLCDTFREIFPGLA